MWTSLTTARPDSGIAAGKPFGDEPPLRAELFSTDQMAEHGVALASAHRLQSGRVPERLLSRLAANERVLIETCEKLTTAIAAKHRITPRVGYTSHPRAQSTGWPSQRSLLGYLQMVVPSS